MPEGLFENMPKGMHLLLVTAQRVRENPNIFAKDAQIYEFKKQMEEYRSQGFFGENTRFSIEF